MKSLFIYIDTPEIFDSINAATGALDSTTFEQVQNTWFELDSQEKAQVDSEVQSRMHDYPTELFLKDILNRNPDAQIVATLTNRTTGDKTVRLIPAIMLSDDETEEPEHIEDSSSLTEYQKRVIEEMAMMDFESGLTQNDPEAVKELFAEDEDFENAVDAAVDYYFELLDYGPAGMLEAFPELDWSEDFRSQYEGL